MINFWLLKNTFLDGYSQQNTFWCIRWVKKILQQKDLIICMHASFVSIFLWFILLLLRHNFCSNMTFYYITHNMKLSIVKSNVLCTNDISLKQENFFGFINPHNLILTLGDEGFGSPVEFWIRLVNIAKSFQSLGNKICLWQSWRVSQSQSLLGFVQQLDRRL